MKTILFRDKKWLVKHETPDRGFAPDELNIVKYKFNSELVLKQGNVLFFLEEITELAFSEVGGSGSNEIEQPKNPS